jgi:hypothetical protein
MITNLPSYDPTLLNVNEQLNTIGNITYNSTKINDYSGVISAKDVDIDGISLKETLSKIQERLLILEPKKELLEKYDALKEAYDHFKLLEKLLTESDN